jgi:hypothetical protein
MNATMKTVLFPVAAFLLLGLVHGAGWAQDTVGIAPINPVPDLQEPPQSMGEMKEMRIDADYHGWGQIDRFGDDGIVVDDEFWKVSPRVGYFKGHNAAFSAQPSEFVPGKFVRFVHDPNRVIVVLWLFDPPPE